MPKVIPTPTPASAPAKARGSAVAAQRAVESLGPSPLGHRISFGGSFPSSLPRVAPTNRRRRSCVEPTELLMTRSPQPERRDDASDDLVRSEGRARRGRRSTAGSDENATPREEVLWLEARARSARKAAPSSPRAQGSLEEAPPSRSPNISRDDEERVMSASSTASEVPLFLDEPPSSQRRRRPQRLCDSSSSSRGRATPQSRSGATPQRPPALREQPASRGERSVAARLDFGLDLAAKDHVAHQRSAAKPQQSARRARGKTHSATAADFDGFFHTHAAFAPDAFAPSCDTAAAPFSSTKKTHDSSMKEPRCARGRYDAEVMLREIFATSGRDGAQPRDGGKTPPLQASRAISPGRTRCVPSHSQEQLASPDTMPAVDDGTGATVWGALRDEDEYRGSGSGSDCARQCGQDDSKSRPVPDQTAFADQMRLDTASPRLSISSPCPASPEREPAWRAQRDRRARDSDEDEADVGQCAHSERGARRRGRDPSSRQPSSRGASGAPRGDERRDDGDCFEYYDGGDDSRLECDASFNSGLDSAEVGAGAFADAVDDSDSQASSSSHAFRVCRRQVSFSSSNGSLFAHIQLAAQQAAAAAMASVAPSAGLLAAAKDVDGSFSSIGSFCLSSRSLKMDAGEQGGRARSTLQSSLELTKILLEACDDDVFAENGDDFMLDGEEEDDDDESAEDDGFREGESRRLGFPGTAEHHWLSQETVDGRQEDEYAALTGGEDEDAVMDDDGDSSGAEEHVLEDCCSTKETSSSLTARLRRSARRRRGSASQTLLSPRARAREKKRRLSDVKFSRDFEVVRRLGSGAFSDVYEARCLADGALYAIKRTRRPFRSKRARDAALVEARALRALGAPGTPTTSGGDASCGSRRVVRFYRAWQEGGHLHSQLELCALGSLRQLVDSTSGGAASLMESPQLWRVARDVAEGLAHVHLRGFVHLDVKPSNVLLTADGQLKIGDFGLTAPLGELHDGVEGDLRYLASELLAAHHRHAASADVFSLGLMLYELGSARALPSGGQHWHALRQGKAQPLYPERSEAYDALTRAMMAPDPAHRPTAEQVAHAPLACAAADTSDCGGWLHVARRASPAAEVSRRPTSPDAPLFDADHNRLNTPGSSVRFL